MLGLVSRFLVSLFIAHVYGVENFGRFSLVAAVVSMAGSLGLTTVAEGVETRESLDSVIRRGCTRAQGNYLHRPMSSADFVRWWRERL